MNYHFPSIAHTLEWAVLELTQKGIDNPRLDAEVLLTYCMNTDRVSLYRDAAAVLGRDCQEKFCQYVARRARREPVAYITGMKEFRSLVFRITPDVLIPRPETETIIDGVVTAYSALKGRGDSLRILEVGTGSGIIAVSLAKELGSIRVIATDCTLQIVELARTNAQLHKLEDKICFLVGDMLKPIITRDRSQQFDFILSNPPYLSDEEWNQAQPEIKAYEPERALRSGPDGLSFYRELIPEAAPLLSRGGYVMLEVGRGQAERVSKLIGQTGLFESVSAAADLSGITRIVMGKKR